MVRNKRATTIRNHNLLPSDCYARVRKAQLLIAEPFAITENKVRES